MGDRRKGDRRSPEEGVIKIQKKSVWISTVLIVILIGTIVLNIVTWSLYLQMRKRYNTVIDHYYNEDTNNNSRNISNTAKTKNEENNKYTCDISINGNKKSIKPGEEIEYEIRVSNINAEKGIKSFESYIDYDSNIFDCKVVSNEEKNWSKIGFIEGYLTLYKSENINAEDQKIVKLVFTAKSEVSSKEYKVALKNMKFTTADDQIFKVADSDIEIKVD